MTKLLYMEDFDVIMCQANVVALEEHEGQAVVVLDQTCFYAKGGGQDFDQGNISSPGTEFAVEAVFFVDDQVKHVGHYEKGTFKIGDHVECRVDQIRRQLNSRLHSAGHVIDMAVRQLGYSWVAGKGAHYPHMAFVEYNGEFSTDDKDQIINAIQDTAQQLLAKGSHNTIKFMTPEEMAACGAVVPHNLPKGKPSRAVFYDDFAVPCGGTHVKNIADIGTLKITNVKRKDGNIRVSYSLD